MWRLFSSVIMWWLMRLLYCLVLSHEKYFSCHIEHPKRFTRRWQAGHTHSNVCDFESTILVHCTNLWWIYWFGTHFASQIKWSFYGKLQGKYSLCLKSEMGALLWTSNWTFQLTGRMLIIASLILSTLRRWRKWLVTNGNHSVDFLCHSYRRRHDSSLCTPTCSVIGHTAYRLLLHLFAVRRRRFLCTTL